ncbi:integral membrane [Emericellopsis cladophorae]|uniref:Integral membrane n=1 Tax=Emericellopsis cladophorae TaxID=2686198 RepID=A0A9Q0BDH1_9HYPO|nr:integral membrane [Emericellopsis cladophorae]KAI6780545.1 integral membrane [Emericellopsis cladophorae]
MKPCGRTRIIACSVSCATVAMLFIAEENLYLGTMFTVKLSILATYNLIVSSRIFRRCSYLVGLTTLLWCIAALIVTNVQCKPLRKLWGAHSDGGWCIAQRPFHLAMTDAHIVGTLTTLGLALPVMLWLNLSDRKKRLLMVAFGLGGIQDTCAIGIIRFVYTICQPVRSTEGATLFILSVLSTIQVTLGLLCASLPTYVYFFSGFDWPFHASDMSVKITGGKTRGPRRSGIVVMDEVAMTRHENVNGAWRRVLNDDEEDEKALMPSRQAISARERRHGQGECRPLQWLVHRQVFPLGRDDIATSYAPPLPSIDHFLKSDPGLNSAMRPIDDVDWWLPGDKPVSRI